MNIMFRFMGFIRILSDKKIPSKYIGKDPEDPEALRIHPGVVYAAALCPLNKDGWFDPDLFTQKIDEVIKERKLDEE